MLVTWFHSKHFGYVRAEPDTLHEIAGAVALVRSLTKDKVNVIRLWDSHPLDAGDVLRRVDKSLSELEALAEAAHRAPRKGRKIKRPDLHTMVGVAHSFWRYRVNREPTNQWHKGQPVSDFACFCAAIVEYVEPSSLAQLPTAMKSEMGEWNKLSDEHKRALSEIASKSGRF